LAPGQLAFARGAAALCRMDAREAPTRLKEGAKMLIGSYVNVLVLDF